MAFNLFCCGLNGALHRHVDLHEVNAAESGLLELPDGLSTSLRTPRAQQHGTPRAGKSAADFQADAFVPAGYQCNLLRDCHLTESSCRSRLSKAPFRPTSIR